MAFIEYSTISSEILYRRLDFGIHNILDEPDERISVQEIDVSVPTRKCTISDEARRFVRRGLKFCFPLRIVSEKAVRRRLVIKRNRQK